MPRSRLGAGSVGIGLLDDAIGFGSSMVRLGILELRLTSVKKITRTRTRTMRDDGCLHDDDCD